MALSPTKFITIGDVHVGGTNDGSSKLITIVNFVNSIYDSDPIGKKVDFAIVLGDIVDTNTTTNFNNAKIILDGLRIPYYVIQGNHDGMSTCYSNCGSERGCNFRNAFGSPDKVVKFNGYQLIFVGICSNETWKFDFNRSDIDKNKPTLIFNHGPVQPGKGSNSGYCGSGVVCSDWGTYAYACGMKVEVDKFTNLLGFYSGHVHCYSKQIIKTNNVDTLYVTEDNIGGNGPVGDYIGYTCLDESGILSYTRLNYTLDFISQDPNCDIGIVTCGDPICNLIVS